MSPLPVPRLWGVVLAAGASARMGRPKALLAVPARDQPGASDVSLVLAHVRALATRCDRVVVVVGAGGEAVAAEVEKEAKILWNLRWRESTKGGPSLALALTDLPEDARVLVTPVDAPPASAQVLDALLAAGPPAVPAWEGQDSHPVLVNARETRAALVSGTLRDALREATRVPADGPPRDLNTPEDWEDWLASLRGR